MSPPTIKDISTSSVHAFKVSEYLLRKQNLSTIKRSMKKILSRYVLYKYTAKYLIRHLISTSFNYALTAYLHLGRAWYKLELVIFFVCPLNSDFFSSPGSFKLLLVDTWSTIVPLFSYTICTYIRGLHIVWTSDHCILHP